MHRFMSPMISYNSYIWAAYALVAFGLLLMLWQARAARAKRIQHIRMKYFL